MTLLSICESVILRKHLMNNYVLHWNRIDRISNTQDHYDHKLTHDHQIVITITIERCSFNYDLACLVIGREIA